MSGPRETRPDSDAPTGALALHRDMRDQALKVPWRELASACEQMATWRSFGLWVRAIADAEMALPDWLAAVIEDRCPAFLQSRRTGSAVESLWLDLSGWVDFHFFPEAMQGGWIQALHYYYGRQQASERIWQHWTRMDGEWRMRRPAIYPTFDQWQQEIAKASTPTSATSQYVEWEAFALWVRNLVEATREVPAIVQVTLEERCPGFLARVNAVRAKPCSDPQWLWDQLRRWIEEHAFAEALCDSSIDSVRADAHRQLRSERVVDYWTVAQDCLTKEALPTFEQWLDQADAFVIR